MSQVESLCEIRTCRISTCPFHLDLRWIEMSIFLWIYSTPWSQVNSAWSTLDSIESASSRFASANLESILVFKCSHQTKLNSSLRERAGKNFRGYYVLVVHHVDHNLLVKWQEIFRDVFTPTTTHDKSNRENSRDDLHKTVEKIWKERSLSKKFCYATIHHYLMAGDPTCSWWD